MLGCGGHVYSACWRGLTEDLLPYMRSQGRICPSVCYLQLPWHGVLPLPAPKHFSRSNIDKGFPPDSSQELRINVEANAAEPLGPQAHLRVDAGQGTIEGTGEGCGVGPFLMIPREVLL